MNKKPKVFVGVSGGVDSSVALALLQKATPNNFEKLFGRPTPEGFRDGFDVTGVFLKTWHPDFLPCDWKEERRSAMRVCATLGVPFLTMDCEAEYKKEVADYMIREYKMGRTPNPDVFCNKYVKFGVFLKKALEMGADFIATGHYSQIGLISKKNLVDVVSFGETSQAGQARLEEFFNRKISVLPKGYDEKEIFNYEYQLHESVDKNKDQSYFLYTLNQEQLSRSLFPIGGMTKPEVRKLAEKFGLPTATKKDSQGVCFLGKLDMREFLSHFIKTKRGDVLNTSSEVIGYHDGAIFYTIGARQGYNILKKTPNEPRYFVVAKDLDKNTITVANKETEAEDVFSTSEVVVSDMHFISNTEPKLPLKCLVRIRYRQEKQKCTISRTCRREPSARERRRFSNKENRIENNVLRKQEHFFDSSKKSPACYVIKFDKPQNGVAVGQSAVLYDACPTRSHGRGGRGDKCLGGGIIEKTL